MANFIDTNFNADTVGQLPAGWVNKSGTWSVVSSGGIGDGRGFLGAADSNAVLYQSQAVADVEVTYQAQIPTGATSYRPQGVILRSNTAYTQGYLVLFGGGLDFGWAYNTATIYRKTGSGPTDWESIGSGTIGVPTGLAVGDVVNVSFKIEGSTIQFRLWKQGTSRPDSGDGFLQVTDTTFSASGYVGFFAAGTSNPPVDNLTANNLGETVATAYTVTGANSGNIGDPITYTVAANGSLAGDVTVTINASPDGTLSSSTVVLAAGPTPSGTFTYTPATAGTKTLSFTNNGALGNQANLTVTASTGPQVVPVTDPAILWAPTVWHDVQVGTYGVATRSMQSSSSGAYLKFRVQACTDVSLLIDSSISAGMPAGDRPSIRYSVDGGPWQIVQVASQTSISLLAGAASGDRNFDVLITTIENAGTRFSLTPGVSLTNGVRIRGIGVNGGSVMAPHSFLAPKRMAMGGDSITEGIFAGTGWNNFTAGHNNDDPLSASVPMIAQGLAAEYGQIGFGAQGWLGGGSAGAPFPNTWNKFATDQARSFAGIDYLLCMHGTNDGFNGAVESTALAWLSAARAALDPGAWIFLIIPPGGYSKPALTAAHATYMANNPGDTRTVLIDISAHVAPYWFNTYAPSQYATDGLHPTALGNAHIAAAVIREIRDVISGVAGGGGGGGGGGETTPGTIFKTGPIL